MHTSSGTTTQPQQSLTSDRSFAVKVDALRKVRASISCEQVLIKREDALDDTFKGSKSVPSISHEQVFMKREDYQ